MTAPPPALLADLRRRHADPRRAYHGWPHVEALLKHLDAVAERLHDAVAVRWAILFHDAIYEAQRGDNEERSARLLEERAAGLLPPATLARAARLIRMTAGHALPDGLPPDEATDAALFLDMDLSILGAPPALFDAYDAGIRREYAHVPEAAWRAGRGHVLRGFLTRPRLFLSDWGRARFENAARANLQRALAALDAAAQPEPAADG